MPVNSKETEILSEIRDSEKKAEEIIERAKRRKEEMLQEAARNSSKLLATKKHEIIEVQEKKFMDFRDQAKSIKNEKLEENKKVVGQIKAKSKKNTNKAIEFVLKKFEEMI